MNRLAVIFLLLLSFATHAQHGHETKPAPAKPAVIEPGLGGINHPVTTKNAQAQGFFNQGLAYIYAFNHAESIKAFARAAELDPNLAMAYWGAALAMGSNYNLPADSAALKEAYANLAKAQALAPKASAKEQDYIKALSNRYATDPDKADLPALAVAYKNAMGELVKKYPDDLDAATLYAESMMNLRPWQLWTLDGKPAEGTLEIVAVLEGVLKRNPNHSGANHYYIHTVEASPNPERALPSAKRLSGIAPNAGHLVHMPSHIYIRTGDYVEAAKSNADAIVADQNYIRKYGAHGVYPMMYYNHNIHFLASANAMNGNYAGAIKSARDLHDNVKPLVTAMPMLEMFTPYPMVTLVRFRKWEVILRDQPPEAGMVITTAMWHFARGMAYAETGQPAYAAKERGLLLEKRKAIPADTPWGNSTAQGVLRVAADLLAGDALLAAGNHKAAIEYLREAVAAEDAVNYNEPPDWDLPTREWLGRALLTDGQYAEAEKVYRDELVKHPGNGRALFGLVEALKKQRKNKDVAAAQTNFQNAWVKADTTLVVSDLYFSK
jgi:tetratricopeptide (TPR) repeat protein